MINKHLMKNFMMVWGVIFLAILVVYNVQQASKNPVIRGRLERVEPFQSATPPVEDSVETIGELEPADATINKPREPYSLLKGVLPLSDQRLSPTSQRCYDADFQPRIEKTGNYRQLTNNYKRGAPDSCSAPLHEFVLSYYVPPSI